MNEIDVLRATLAGLSLAVPRWVEDIGTDDPAALVLLLDDLRGLRQELASVEAYAEAQAARAMAGTRRLELPDGRVAERRPGELRKEWQHGAILGRLWALAAEQAGGDLEESATAYRRAIEAGAHIDYWRVGALRTAGIAADDYCNVERGRATVHISAKPMGDAA